MMKGLRYRFKVGRVFKRAVTGVVVKENAKTVLIKLDPPEEGHVKLSKKRALIPC